MPVIVLQLDGLVIEKCVNMGDGQFKEGTWVKIAEEFENNPEHPSLSKFRGVYGRLTKRYHGCWCVKWLSHEEAISQALGQRYVSEGPWQLCKLGSEFHGTWLRFDSVRQIHWKIFDCLLCRYVAEDELYSLTISTRRALGQA
jgi:hypothetical protein